MASSTIKVLPAQLSDMVALAPSSLLPLQETSLAWSHLGRPLNLRSAQALALSHIPGEVARITKAVMTDSDGKEEIVGLASWRMFTAADAVIT